MFPLASTSPLYVRVLWTKRLFNAPFGRGLWRFFNCFLSTRSCLFDLLEVFSINFGFLWSWEGLLPFQLVFGDDFHVFINFFAIYPISADKNGILICQLAVTML